MRVVTLSYIELLNLPVVFLLGIITSYQDLKEGKIKNKWVLFALGYSFLSLGLVLAIFWMNNIEIKPAYIQLFFTNIIVALGFGVFLWLCRLWSPGDAKLFLAYAALVPLSTYKWGNIGFFPSYIILINTFTPIFVFFLIRIFLRLKPKTVWTEFRKALDYRVMFQLAIFVIGFSAMTDILLSMLNIAPNLLISTIFMLGVMLFFTNILKVDLLVPSIICVVIRLALEYKTIFAASFWIMFAEQMLFFVVLRYFILNLGARALSTPRYIEDLEPGMCLAEDIIEDKGKYVRKANMPISFLQSLFETLRTAKSIFQDYMCVSKEDIAKLRQLHSEGKVEEHHVFVYEKISFALFIFVGVIITIIAQGDSLIVLRLLLERFI